ncbi:MAG: AMP-binding protein [Hyphomicrobiales bacterium]|nr:AMP-binding protein [Hyphomicrobiales bacterium]
MDGSARHDPGGRRAANAAWLRALEAVAPIERAPARLFADLLRERAAEAPGARAVSDADGSMNRREFAALATGFAALAIRRGWGRGDTVALHAGNSAAYLACWIGLSSAGVVVALLNAQARGEALIHAMRAAGAKAAIADEAGGRAFADLPAGATGVGVEDFAGSIEESRALGGSGEVPPSRGVTIGDPALLIYTSGTTGLPKAARVSHRRVLNWALWFAGLAGFGADDVMYDALPLFHSVGGVVAPCATLAAGGSVHVARRFSLRDFWREIVETRATAFQYIGELCRLLADAPDDPFAARHELRLAVGNGLAADVWERFRARFAIPRVLEFYAATEGNFSLFNVEGRPGALGRVPPFLAHRFPAALVRHDEAEGAPLRGPDGRCVACGPGEPGEAIGRIEGAGGGAFEGYVDAAASDAKALRDVFADGDRWFRTGDLMTRDADGFWRFVARIGDTWRWKGENVSAAEVEAALRACPGVDDAIAYGVAVTGHAGRAGMAALVADEIFDAATLAAALAARLPPAAMPRFLRIEKALAATATFKPVKSLYAREGYAPGVADALFVLDTAAGAYAPLDADRRAAIEAGRARI